MDYGIKVVKPGVDISTLDIRNITFSSKYPMLKYHSDSQVSVNIPWENTSIYTVAVTHNLGYIPVFIAYRSSITDPDITDSYQRMLPITPYGIGGPALSTSAYATATQVICRTEIVGGKVGYYEQEANGSTNYWDDKWSANNFWVLGRKDDIARNGAIRFTNVTIPNSVSISSAYLSYFTEFESTDLPNLVLTRVYGIDEDNTADFSSNPMGRTATAASTDDTCSLPSGYHDVDVKSIVEEIIARSGWASGNAMGFKMYNNGSTNQNWIEDDQPTGDNTILKIQRAGTTTINFRVIIFKDKIA